jgi:chromosomal replication initiator protein
LDPEVFRFPCAHAFQADRIDEPGQFIGGPENRLVELALNSIFAGHQTTEDYRLWVFCGPSGVGKSTLMHGIAREWPRRHPDQPVVLTSGSDWARQHAAALKDGPLGPWGNSHQRLALFLMDDVDRISHRVAAQRELVRVIDDLQARLCRLVFTCKVDPASWHLFQPALASRLSGGLTVALQLPGAACRQAVVATYCKRHAPQLSPRTVTRLAGALAGTVPAIRSRLASSLFGAHTVEEGTPSAAQPIAWERLQPRPLPLRSIVGSVARYFGVANKLLAGPSRRQAVVLPRAVAMYLARKHTRLTLKQIGWQMGRRDHTTVLHACRKIESLVPRDPCVRQAVGDLSELLTSSERPELHPKDRPR